MGTATSVRPGILNANVASSAALIAFFMNVIDLGRKQFKVDMAMGFIKSLGLLVLDQCHTLGGMQLSFCNMDLTLDSHGAVHNLATAFQVLHKAVCQVCKEEWSHMKSDGYVTADFDSPQLPFLDVLVFVTLFFQYRRHKKKRQMSSDYMDKLKASIITFLADALHSYVFTVYARSNQMYAQQAISRKRWGSRSMFVSVYYFCFLHYLNC